MTFLKTRVMVTVVSIGIILGLVANFATPNNNKADTIEFNNSLAQFSDEDMASMASLILKGKVIDIEESKWNTPDGNEPDSIGFKDMIYHDVIVNIENIYKGTSENKGTVKVRVYGGEVNNSKKIKEIIDDSAAKFLKGEEVILFLANDDTPFNRSTQNDYYILLGSKQGKYEISGNNVKNMYGEKSIKNLLDKVEKHKNDTPRIKKGDGNI